MLKENYDAVRQQIDDACYRSGRDPREVTLIAVSKTKPVSMIRELYDAGVRDFGENYVQELVEKYNELPKDIRWHMIGHLQRNKVKYIAPFVYLIHSVDSLALAETIEKEAVKAGRNIPVLLEVNAGEEESKFGVSVTGAPSLLAAVDALPHVLVRGFMTSAPFLADPEAVRPVFRKMRKLKLDTAFKNHNNEEVNMLSQGMSNDYPVAVEEGSTFVRIGTDIFGSRLYGNK